jgi:hypothetical protein
MVVTAADAHTVAFERSRALDSCAQGAAGRLGISPAEGLVEALLDGAMDDFTDADLTHASLAGPDRGALVAFGNHLAP